MDSTGMVGIRVGVRITLNNFFQSFEYSKINLRYDVTLTLTLTIHSNSCESVRMKMRHTFCL